MSASTTANQEYEVFISYSSSDLEIAARIHDELASRGLSVWFDKARLQVGCNWYEQIEAACEQSRVVLPVLTPNWRQSAWTRFETYGADQILPLLCEGEFAEVAPPPLQSRQFVDFRHSDRRATDELAGAVRECLACARPEKKSRLQSIPIPPNRFFVGRESQLLELHENFHTAPTDALTQGTIQVISGLGGVGKTTLARQYVEKFWRLYRTIAWTRADQGLVLEFQRLAIEMGIIHGPSDDAEADARMAFAELSQRERCLLVLDNAPDEDAVRGWLPAAGPCHTLVTSRFTGWSAAVRSISVPVLEPDQACELLLRRADFVNDGQNRKEAGELGATLGFLPLALEQAAAFARESAISFQRYLEYYSAAQSRRDLLAQRALGSTHYPASIAATWMTTLRRLSPLSASILKLLAYMGPDDVPRVLLNENVDRLEAAVNARRDEHDSPVVSVTRLSIDQSLAELGRYSMIKLSDMSLSIHRLVQAVQRDWLEEPERVSWASVAASSVECIFPEVRFENWERCKALISHASACLKQILSLKACSPDALRLVAKTGQYLNDQAELNRSEKMISSMLDLVQEATPESACAARVLGDALRTLGKYEESASVLKGAIDTLEKSDTLPTLELAHALRNLSMTYEEQGNYEEAGQLNAQVIAIRTELLGEEHRDVAESLQEAAIIKNRTGDDSGAEQLLKRALAIWNKQLAIDDPDIATAHNNLGLVYQSMERYEDAERCLLEGDKLSRLSLSADHPKVAGGMTNLGLLYENTGRYEEAEQLHREALSIFKKRFGEQHHRVGLVLNNLAAVQIRVGKHDIAEQNLLQVIEIHEAGEARDHRGKAHAYNNLGHSLMVQQKYEQAEGYIRRALDLWREALGPNHSLVCTAMDNLALCLWADGKTAEAKSEYQKLAKNLEKVNPPHLDHRVSVLVNLARLCGDQNNVEESEEMFREAVAVCESHLEQDDARIAVPIRVLARFLQDEDRHAEAEPLLRRALQIAESQEIQDNGLIASDLNNLASTLVDLNSPEFFDEAEAHLRRAIELREDFANASYWLAKLFRLRGDRARELQEWRRYLSLDKSNESRVAEANRRMEVLAAVEN